MGQLLATVRADWQAGVGTGAQVHSGVGVRAPLRTSARARKDYYYYYLTHSALTLLAKTGSTLGSR